MRRKYGCLRDPHDGRDLFLSPRPGVELPRKVDLRPGATPYEDQRGTNTCVGNAVVAAMEYLDKKNDGRWLDLSRLFVYWNARVVAGDDPRVDEGAYIRAAVKGVARYGTCSESLWPFLEGNVIKEPPPATFEEAEKRQVLGYFRCTSLYDFKYALAAGYPVVFGTDIYNSFEAGDVPTTGIVPEKTEGDVFRGRHAICAFGYNDDTGRLEWTKNSWGPWGNKGYVSIPYKYFEDGMISDAWAITDMEDPELITVPENPLPEDTVWYIPIVGIIQFIWNWIKRSQPSDKGGN